MRAPQLRLADMAYTVLILGGSSEATAIATGVAGDARVQAVLSLAGRTQAPAASPLPQRCGGFGGIDGLAAYLDDHEVDALVVAVHPFAARMRRNAVAAVRRRPTRLLIVDRPPWTPEHGDRWRRVPDLDAAARALEAMPPQRVLLTTGRQALAPFAAVGRHAYLIRSIDPPVGWPGSAPADAQLILARGPFAEADERRLMLDHGVDVLVTKNAGGAATEGKLLAARGLGVEVIMIERPPLPDIAGMDVQVVQTAAQALAWLDCHASAATERGV